MKINSVLLAVVAVLCINSISLADINRDNNQVAIKGYDVVAYFIGNAPLQGVKEYSYDWMDATWYFAKQEHKDLFIEDPIKYAPQYGGYCAYAVSTGSKAPIDPQAFSIVNDKLYLNFNKAVKNLWERNQTEYIKKADVNWKIINR